MRGARLLPVLGVAREDTVAGMHSVEPRQRLGQDHRIGVLDLPEVSLHRTEAQQVERRQRYIVHHSRIFGEAELRLLHPHGPLPVARNDGAALDLGALRQRRLEGTARRDQRESAAYPVGIHRPDAVGISDRTVVAQIVGHLHHHHVECREGQRQARDVQHRGHLVTPQRRNEILECYFHLSNCNFNRFPSSGSHVTRRPVRARGSRLRRASCAA